MIAAEEGIFVIISTNVILYSVTGCLPEPVNPENLENPEIRKVDPENPEIQIKIASNPENPEIYLS